MIDKLLALIQAKDFYFAVDLLEKKTPSSHRNYWLSLLYRYLGFFNKEKKLIDSVNKGSSQYLKKREDWYRLDIYERLVSRPLPYFERIPERIPSEETLSQTCFVLMSSTTYFLSLLDQIKSIKATKSYNNLPIFVLDIGLTDDEKNTLESKFNIKHFKKAKWDPYVVKNASQLSDAGCLKRKEKWGEFHYPTLLGATWSQRFVPDKYFPGYRFYFQPEADGWVQDEQCLDSLLYQAKQSGVSSAQDPRGFGNLAKWHRTWFENEYYLSLLKDRIQTTSSILCIDTAHTLHIDCHKFLQKLTLEHDTQVGMMDLFVLNLVSSEKNIKTWVEVEAVGGLPSQVDSGFFMSSKPHGKYIGQYVTHIGPRFNRYTKKVLVKNTNEMQKNMLCRSQEFQQYAQQFNAHQGKEIETSVAFSVWPFKEKVAIESILKKSVESFDEKGFEEVVI